jgi:hypothetical protein
MKKNTIKSNLLNTCKILATSIIIFSCKKDDVSATVTVYEDSNYTGISKSLVIGEFFVTKGSFDPVGNDKITSIKIPSTLKCTLCDNDNGVGGDFGTCITLTEDVVDLTTKSFNDKASYIKIEKR